MHNLGMQELNKQNNFWMQELMSRITGDKGMTEQIIGLN
jgi:hypothetical protein